MTGDRAWQWKYTILIMAGAFLTAVLATYLIERPAAKWILRPRKYEERELMVSVYCEELPAEYPCGAEKSQETEHTESTNEK
ncbi:MAG: hypothetical protein ABFD03_05540, partial [Clostridiaceae bacterium]